MRGLAVSAALLSGLAVAADVEKPTFTVSYSSLVEISTAGEDALRPCRPAGDERLW